MVVQAAESMLRQRLGVREVYGVRLVRRRRLLTDGPVLEDEVDFAVDRGVGNAALGSAALGSAALGGAALGGAANEEGGGQWRVVLRTAPGEPTLLTCRAGTLNAPPTYTEVHIERIEA
jgi:hypothetical protein